MPGASDADLLEAFRHGDEAAFNELVLRYQERVYWVARRFVGDHDAANDVVQDVFVRAYEGLRSFRGDASFYTWVYRIAVNLSLNAIRRQRVREFFRLDDVFHLSDDAGLEPDRKMEADEQRKLIEEAIETLPERQKAVFLLRYYEELPYDQIAPILNTSVGGLKANYFHAVKKIGRYINRAHGSRTTSTD